MDYSYLTVGKKARTEQIIEKSRFIVTVCPVKSREEAEAFFSEVRSEFKDATHNVPAMVIGEKKQIQWGSDDGEPQGTSGAPIVMLLVNKDLTDVAIVVTRYFGGVKLGTGGLVRAYTSSAELGIEEAGIVAAVPFIEDVVYVDYGVYNKIINYRFTERLKENMLIENAEFSENVSFRLATRSDINGEIKGILTELAGGNIRFSEIGEVLKFIPLKILDKSASSL